MDDRRLREYAFKIYKGESDYSLQKAFRLFPKYYPKIAFFYTELLVQKQQELTRRTIQSLGIDKAVEMRNIAAAAHEEMKKYRNKIINDLRTLDKNKEYFNVDENTAALYASMRYDKNIQILKDVKDFATLNGKALESVKNTAKYYGFSNIFSEAESYVVKNREIMWQIIAEVKYYEQSID